MGEVFDEVYVDVLSESGGVRQSSSEDEGPGYLKVSIEKIESHSRGPSYAA
jgi:hypothetical protein